jgi:hypothetical protein
VHPSFFGCSRTASSGAVRISQADTQAVEDGLFDDELLERRLVELEESWVATGAEVRRLAVEAGFTFEPETFVMGEVLRSAAAAQSDPERELERLEGSGLLERVVDRLDEGPG